MIERILMDTGNYNGFGYINEEGEYNRYYN